MHIKIVKFDETSHWSEDIAKKAGRIFGVYFVDVDFAIHICDFTPSYELYFVESIPENKIENDEEWEKLRDDLKDGDCYSELESYYYTRSVDGLPKIGIAEYKEGQTELSEYWPEYKESLKNDTRVDILKGQDDLKYTRDRRCMEDEDFLEVLEKMSIPESDLTDREKAMREDAQYSKDGDENWPDMLREELQGNTPW